MAQPEQTLDEVKAHDCDPNTDEDTFNHRFDDEGNTEPASDE